MNVKTETLHGRSMSYREAGTGPVLLLVHGMGGSAENWQAGTEPLARDHTVIAPDLPGHGQSEPGGGDYSVGGLAAGLRDLLLVLRPERATLVRAAALPGAGPFIAATAPAVGWMRSGFRRAEAAGLRPSTDVDEVSLGYA